VKKKILFRQHQVQVAQVVAQAVVQEVVLAVGLVVVHHITKVHHNKQVQRIHSRQPDQIRLINQVLPNIRQLKEQVVVLFEVNIIQV